MANPSFEVFFASTHIGSSCDFYSSGQAVAQVVVDDFCAAITTPSACNLVVTFLKAGGSRGYLGTNVNGGVGASSNDYFAFRDLVAAYSTTNGVVNSFYNSLPATSDPYPSTTAFGPMEMELNHQCMLKGGNSTKTPDLFSDWNTVTVNSTVSWSMSTSHRIQGGGVYSMYAVLMHELTELAVRVWSGAYPLHNPPAYMCFTSTGQRLNSSNAPNNYFSWDNGVTNLANFNPQSAAVDCVDFLNTQTGGRGYWNPISTMSGSSGGCTPSFGPGPAQSGSQPLQDLLYIDWQQMACLVQLSCFGIKLAGGPTIDNGGTAPSFTTTGTSVGSVLTAVPGTWFGDTTITKTYQWNRNSVAISGANSSQYTAVSSDGGTTLSLVETASNSINFASIETSGISITASSSTTPTPTTVGLMQIRR